MISTTIFHKNIQGDPYGTKKNIQFLLRTDERDANEIRKKIAASGLSQQEYLLKAALEAEITDPTPHPRTTH